MADKPRYAVPGSTATPSSNSTVQIYATIRRGLLDYRSPQGEMLTELIGQESRIYVRSQPEPAVFPYMTLLLNRTSLAAYNGYRETALLEVQAIGKPESQLPLIESAMDIVDQCLTSWTDARAGGLTIGRSRTRATVPMFSTPAESQTVGVVATYELYLWPTVLTSRATT
jgi:hypothetical protein